MKGNRYIITLFFCLAQLFLYAQAKIEIGAVVETESHLYTLNTIERYKDSLSVNWLIINKKKHSKIYFDEKNIVFRNLSSGEDLKIIKPSSFTVTQDSLYSENTYRLVFQPLKDTLSIISLSLYLVCILTGIDK